jgi:endonuclease G
VWGDLEEYCRELVQQGKELYIIAGPVGRKGSIGRKEKIAVPAKNWKVIVVLDRQGLGMQGVNANTRTIAVMMPNDSSVKGKGWKSFRVSVARVERETGLNFLSNVSPQVQQVIESKVDSQAIAKKSSTVSISRVVMPPSTLTQHPGLKMLS